MSKRFFQKQLHVRTLNLWGSFFSGNYDVESDHLNAYLNDIILSSLKIVKGDAFIDSSQRVYPIHKFEKWGVSQDFRTGEKGGTLYPYARKQNP